MSLIQKVLFLSLLFGRISIFAQSASIAVEKQGQPNPIIAGTDITYTITVSSEGPDDAANAALNDPLPAQTTFATLSSPAAWSCTMPAPNASGTVNCTIAAFPPGSAVFTLVLHTDPGLADGSTLSNTATITTTTSDPDPNDNVSTVDTLVSTSADLGVTKSVTPKPAPIGGSATFTIGYTNNGPSNAANATITDALPAGVLFNTISAAGWTCTTPAVGANGTVSCSMSSLAAAATGSITIGVTIDSSVSPSSTITNTATIGSDTTDPAAANNSASDSCTAQTISNLAITKNAAPNPVVAGSSLTYTIGYSASGPSPAPNVTITDVLPAGTTFTSLVQPGGWNCTTGGTVTCTIASLPAGASGTFTITVSTSPALAAGTTISNTATISGAVTENTSDNSATANVTTSVVSDVAITKTAPASTFAGDAISYSIAWSASGPSNSSNVSITDALPASETFVSITAPGFVCTTNGTITCTAATLAPGSNGTITINATVNANVAAGTVITNTANTANHSSTASTTVNAPTITGVKSVPSAQIMEGSAVTYTIVLHNGGAFTQGDNPGNEFTDVLPSPLQLMSASATSGTAVADQGTNTVHWNGSIAAGADVTITINAIVPPNTHGQTISNRGTIHFDGDNNGTNESTTLTNPPAGSGPTVFAVTSAVVVPALSPEMLMLFAALLGLVAWRVIGVVR